MGDSMSKDISIASFNLYNLQKAGKKVYEKTVSNKEYLTKISWTADMLQEISADVIAFQELWNSGCLVDAFKKAGLTNEYKLIFVKETWGNTAVAMAVRKPWQVDTSKAIKKLPFQNLQKVDLGDGEDDEISVQIDRFSRAVLDVTIGHPSKEVPKIRIFAAHLKSKLATKVNRGLTKYRTTIGSAISTIRRTAEAAGLRWILTDVMKDSVTPTVVVGDLNDDPRSNTLAILTQQPSLSSSATGGDVALYNTLQMQQLSSFRDVFYTHEHNRLRDTLDHVLVSEQFFNGSPDHIWSLRDVRIWNDFIDDDKETTSDHGLIRARFKWG